MPAYFADTLRTNRSQKIIDAVDAGTGPGVMKFYTAPRPTPKGAAVTTQTLLGTVTFADPSGATSNGVLTFNPLTDDSSADADGVAAWVRVLDSAGTFVMDMDVTDNAGTGPVKMPSTQVYAGGVIHITSAVMTEGNN
jgi:hypothetical protein